MKYFYIVTFLILFLSCVDKNKFERINKFENTLGEPETTYLNEMVSDFDFFLNKKYSDKESNFIEYLTGISESDKPDIWKTDNTRLEEIQKTNLFAKYDSIYPDSVWYDDNVFHVLYSAGGITNSIVFTRKESQELNIDSLLNSLKTKPRLEETEPGYFQIALESIMTDVTLIQNYLDAKQTAGTISIRLIASGLLNNFKPEDEYFAKRIIVMEMNN